MSAPSRKKTVTDIQNDKLRDHLNQSTLYNNPFINTEWNLLESSILVFIQFMLSNNPSHSDGFCHNKHGFVYFYLNGGHR